MGLFPQSLLSGETSQRDTSPELCTDEDGADVEELEKLEKLRVENGNGDTG